ncbi:MAG: RNA polymerase sigma-70 factor [Bacteroidales bacterium]|nr:RNA polymerase sigma-70 factor [Bacteroidales bacterium]
MNLILRRIQKGDLKAFESLFKELYSPLCLYANKYLQDKDKAEETVQDIFYGIWKNREKLDIRVSFKSYLYKAVQNNCLQQIQHHLVEDKYKQYVKSEVAHFHSDPAKEMELQEMNEVIEQTLDSLPERCKEIFSMSRFEGLKYREIAEKLEISTKTVEANMGKALQAFRQNLKQYVGVNS